MWHGFRSFYLLQHIYILACIANEFAIYSSNRVLLPKQWDISYYILLRPFRLPKEIVVSPALRMLAPDTISIG